MTERLISFFVIAIVFLFWTLYRLFFDNSLLLEELAIKPILWLLPVLIVINFSKNKNLGFSRHRLWYFLLIGALVGLLTSFSRVLGLPHLFTQISNLSLVTTIIALISALATAITEEIFFRGFLLNRWLRSTSKPYFWLILNGLIFTAFHLPYVVFRLHYSGGQLFSYLLLNFITGFINVFLFHLTRNTVTSLANHTVWNFFSTIIR